VIWRRATASRTICRYTLDAGRTGPDPELSPIGDTRDPGKLPAGRFSTRRANPAFTGAFSPIVPFLPFDGRKTAISCGEREPKESRFYRRKQYPQQDSNLQPPA